MLTTLSQYHNKVRFFIGKDSFTSSPNGLGCAPRIFTKMLKAVYATLGQQGHIVFGYIDDSYLQGANYYECGKNVNDSSALFNQLGFILHDKIYARLCT